MVSSAMGLSKESIFEWDEARRGKPLAWRAIFAMQDEQALELQNQTVGSG